MITATGVRLIEWARGHLRLIAAALVFVLLVSLFASTFRIYDERQGRVETLESAALLFCDRNNELRAALRDYLRQTILIRPILPGADPATAADLEARNQFSREALDRGERSFAALNCHALAEALNNPTERTIP